MDLKFQASTDTEHEFKVSPSIIFANWKTNGAIAGREAEFEIGTALVGVGAPIKVKGKSVDGKNLGTINGKMRDSKYRGKFLIPEDISLDDQIYFEYELSSNSLSGESDKIPVYPPVKYRNMQWDKSEAKRSDVVKMSVELENVREETDVLIFVYEYSSEGAHEKVIEVPTTVKNSKIELEWEVDYPEDTEQIPVQKELDPYQNNYEYPQLFYTFVIMETEYGKEEQVSGLLIFKDNVEHSFSGDDENASGREVKIIFADGTERTESLDSNGELKLEEIPPGRYQIIVTG